MAAMHVKSFYSIILVLSAILAWLVFFWQPATPPSAPLATSPAGGDFTLQSAEGPVTLSDFRGKAVMVYFGYTFCPDICPTSLAFAAQAMKLLAPEDLAHTRMLFISVDPERDTLEKLQEYGPFFHPNIQGVTGNPDTLAEIAARYGASYRKQETGSAGGYVVDHSSNIYLVAPNGALAAVLPHGAPPTEIASAIRAVLHPSSQPRGVTR